MFAFFTHFNTMPWWQFPDYFHRKCMKLYWVPTCSRLLKMPKMERVFTYELPWHSDLQTTMMLAWKLKHVLNGVSLSGPLTSGTCIVWTFACGLMLKMSTYEKRTSLGSSVGERLLQGAVFGTKETWSKGNSSWCIHGNCGPWQTRGGCSQMVKITHSGMLVRAIHNQSQRFSSWLQCEV